ncbi:cytoplasmic dynein intermediate chain [Rhizoctonia solani AG-1 IA]|uniref:Cytoplasmic dynein intermediate chain n=1 Tax=Thanatephorus cucumeris (strain AG1-IA) TaxID=983506 RepID=L8WZY9_THACA|nr:cytoplasmic dynein intermediate chain [Rhizoctonia solani AG-1 IA]
MQDRRRAELDAKRQKLADLKKAREERQKRELARNKEGEKKPVISPGLQEEVDSLLGQLIGPEGYSTPVSSTPGTPSAPRGDARLSGLGTDGLPVSGRISRASNGESVSDKPIPGLTEVQTAEIETEPTGPTEEELRLKIRQEEEAEWERQRAEKEHELEEERKLEKEIEDEIRELTEEERASIYIAPEFLEFVEQSTKIVQRALNDGYDYIRDYTIGTEADGELTAYVPATILKLAQQFPELSAAAYNKNSSSPNEPDGIVCVWNLHLVERPEFVFHAQSDVLSVSFSPFHPNLIFGGTYSGQILLWDTRAKHLPTLKTPLSAAGHTYPVYAMQTVGTQNAHNLITSSTDGTVCSWLSDMLAQPQETLSLAHAGHTKTDEVAVTSLSFPDGETTTFWVGTEEGHVYQANRYDRAGAKAGLNQHDVYKGHAGPVTGIDFHPLAGPVDFSDLFLTSSVDWTVKLWRSRNAAKPSTSPHTISPIYSFDEAGDYVYDVKWHPSHPAVFGCVDGNGRFDLWNLNADTEVRLNQALNGIAKMERELLLEEAMVDCISMMSVTLEYLVSRNGRIYRKLYPGYSEAVLRESYRMQYQSRIQRLLAHRWIRVVDWTICYIPVSRIAPTGNLYKGYDSTSRVDNCTTTSSTFTPYHGRTTSVQAGVYVTSIPGPIEIADEVNRCLHMVIQIVGADSRRSFMPMLIPQCLMSLRILFRFLAIASGCSGELYPSNGDRPHINASTSIARFYTLRMVSHSLLLAVAPLDGTCNLVEAGEDALVLHSGYFADSFADCLETYGAKVKQVKADIGAAVTEVDLENALKEKKYKVVTFTHVDTSTGEQNKSRLFEMIGQVVKRVSPDTLVVLDGVCSVASEEIRMDDWGIDVVLSATQKGLGTPPGLSVVCASQRALNVLKGRKTPVSSYFANWNRWLPIMQAYEKGSPLYFATPPVNLIYAFHASLSAITKNQPSLEERFKLHKEASSKIKKAVADLGLKLVPNDLAFAANGMTAVYFPDGISAPDIIPRMLKQDVVVAAGLHKEVKDKYFRVGHMGITVTDESRGDVDKIISALQKAFAEARAK